MPSKITKTKVNVKITDKKKSAIKSKTLTKMPIKPRVVRKKIELTPPSFQSTVSIPSGFTPKKTNRKNKKKYPLVGLALMAFLVTIISLLFVIYQNKSQWNKFAGNKAEEKITKAVDSLILPEIISDNLIASEKYFLNSNCWSPNGKKLLLLEEDGKNSNYKIFDLKNNTSTAFVLNQNQSNLNLDWLDDNFLLNKNEIIPLTEEDAEDKEIEQNDINDFEKFEEILSQSLKNKSDLIYQISPNKEYLAYISNDQNHLRLMQKNLENSDFDFGSVRTNQDGTLPKIQWSENSQYLIIGQNEMFDAINKKIILPRMEDQNEKRIVQISPDQTKISVIQKSNDQNVKIYLINIDGYKEKNIFTTKDSESNLISASFSGNSRYLAFAYKKQLWLAETKTGKAKLLKSLDKNYQSIFFSPDDLSIAYALESGEIGLISLDWRNN